jgi:hypothetical protein
MFPAPSINRWPLELSYVLHMISYACVLFSATWLLVRGLKKAFVFFLAAYGVIGLIQLGSQLSQVHFHTRLLFRAYWYYPVAVVRDLSLAIAIVLLVPALLNAYRAPTQKG